MTISNIFMINNNKIRYAEISLVILIILFSFFLRIASLNYLDGSDNYNDIAYKNMYENGMSYYKYSVISSKFTQFFINTFGFNSFSLRMPSIVYSIVTVIFTYFIARRINKTAAIFSILLFAISPWSIVLSRVTRDYAFDCMISSSVLFFVLLIIQDAHKKKESHLIINLIYLATIILSLFVLMEFNHRGQTMLVLIFPSIGIMFNIYYILQRRIKNKSLFIFVLLLGSSIGMLFVNRIDYLNFKEGFLFNRFYLDIFFGPYMRSPWQWFHGNDINYATRLYFLFFLVPLIYNLLYKKKDISDFLYLYIFFFAGIAVFVFKFQTHVNYNPTRYIYFLFPVYVIIFAFAFYYLVTKITKNNWYRSFIFCIAMALFINVKSFWYAVYPEKAYKNENTSTLLIDNIGVGHFEMDAVVDFLKKELEWDNKKIFVFGGRYGEFILLLDYKMDTDRCLLKENSPKYDVGKNMYVESDYFNYHELEYAVKNHQRGYFVIRSSVITDNDRQPLLKLRNADFVLYNTDFIFITNINNFKIYKWSHK